MRRDILLTVITAVLCTFALTARSDEPNAVAWKINEIPAELRLVGPRYLYEDTAEFTADIPVDRQPLTCRIRIEKNGGGFRKTLNVPAISTSHSRQSRKNGKVYEIRMPMAAALWPDGEYTAVLEYIPGKPPQNDDEEEIAYRDGPTAEFRVVRKWVKENVVAANRREFAVWLEHVNRPRDVWKKVPHWRNVGRVFEKPSLLYDRLRGLVLRSYPNVQLGRLQPYTVYVPNSYDANEPWPLMILLHGSGGDYRNVISDLYEGQELETNPMLIANAGAFTRQEYRHMALEDVMGVLEDMQSKYNVDANRVYVQGISLGGRGSIELAALRPHVFAATCPQGVYGMFQQAADPAGMAAMDPYARWQLARWDLRSYLPNARTVPMQIIFGRSDTTTPPHNALVFRHLLRYYLGGQAEAVGFDAGHNISYPQYKWSDSRKWLLNHRRQVPERVVARTASLRHGRFHWVTIEGMEKHWQMAEVDARLVPKTNVLMVRTRNTTRLTLSPPRKVDTLIIDDTQLGIGDDVDVKQPIRLDRVAEATWALAPKTPTTGPAARAVKPKLRKVPGQSGPIWDFCFRKAVAVYGTGGGAERTAALKEVASQARMLDVAWGDQPWPVVADTEVTEIQKREYNLILVGTAETNRLLADQDWPFPVSRKQLPAIPAVTNAGKHSLLHFIYPSPFAEGRYVYVIRPLGKELPPAALRPADTWNALTWADWAVVDFGEQKWRGRTFWKARTLADGVFDNAWKPGSLTGKSVRPRYMNWERGD